MIPKRRRETARLTDPALLESLIKDADYSVARFARYVGTSRQFIWALINDPAQSTCTPAVADRIEHLLGHPDLFERTTA